jgi:hypothetical protein
MKSLVRRLVCLLSLFLLLGCAGKSLRKVSCRRVAPRLSKLVVVASILISTSTMAAGFTTVTEAPLFKDPYSLRARIVQAKAGGYIIAGEEFAYGGSDLLRVDSTGKVLWRKKLAATRAASQSIYTAFEAGDESILVGGTSSSLDLVGEHWAKQSKSNDNPFLIAPHPAFLAKFDKSGRLLWKRAYGPLTDRWQRSEFDRGIAVSDGYLMIGRKLVENSGAIRTETDRYTEHVWIVRLTQSGDVQWERTLSEDQGNRLYAKYDELDVSNILVEPNDDTVFAAAVNVVPISDPNETKTGAASPHQKRILVLRFNKNGDELTRSRYDGMFNPLILRSGPGYVLFYNRGIDERDSLYFARLDSELRTISLKPIASQYFLRAAVTDANGGAYVLGQYVPAYTEKGFAMVGHVSATGELTHKTTMTSRFLLFFESISWWFFSSAVDITIGAQQDEVAVLWRTHHSDPMKLTILRLQR